MSLTPVENFEKLLGEMISCGEDVWDRLNPQPLFLFDPISAEAECGVSSFIRLHYYSYVGVYGTIHHAPPGGVNRV